MNNLNKHINVLKYICQHSKTPGKKMVQKLMYLIERKGVNLNLNYRIHYFGPYSAKLDNFIHAMKSEDIINIDTGGMSHTISMKNDVPDVGLDQYEIDKVLNVLKTFGDKTPFELEGITTLDLVANSIKEQHINDDAIIDDNED